VTEPTGGALPRWPTEEHLVFRTGDPGDARDQAQTIMARHRMELDGGDGNFEASVHRAGIGSLELLHFAYRAPTRIISAPLDGFVAVHVPRRGTLRVSQGDDQVVVTPGAAAVISPGIPIELTWSAGLDLLVVKVPETPLLQRAADLTGVPVRGSLTFDLLHPLVAGSTLAAALGLALRGASLGAVVGAMASAVSESVVTGLLLGHGHDREDAIWAARPLPTGVVQVVADAVRADPVGDHTTQRLARLVGVSERTLQLTFARSTGCSPMAYVRGLRLELARERLLTTSTGPPTVLDVATGCGFGHAGRFAAAYRARFGEAPSETLRRVR
jgi:AraC-like DNA-binding protein